MKGLEYIFIGCLMLLLAACQQQDVMEESEELAELTFKIALLDSGSRGNVTDYPSNPTNWTQAEKVVDGRYLYVVSVYLVDANKNIAASQENIVVDNQAVEKEVTFDKDYNLKRGIYTLMAVANHKDHTIGAAKYSCGLVGTWKSADYTELMNNQIISTAENISSKEIIQPLSLMKEIELHAGHNEIEGELVRSFARLRIEVKNNSGSMPLKINSLTFSDNFSQKQAYVFDDGTDRKYSFDTGAPVSASTHALQPFITDDGQSYKTIEAQTSGVVFDSYLLESQSTKGYTYTLDLKYEGVTTTTTTYSRTGNAISQVNKLGVSEESYYLIYNTNSGRYLSAGDDVVETAQLENVSDLRASVVWQVSKNGDYYYIKNVETKQYMQSPGQSSVALSENTSSFVLSSSNNRIRIKASGNNGRYISVQDNQVNGVSGTWNNPVNFYFYKVQKTTTTSQDQDITYNTPITLTTIDPITQQATPATAIKRNDFINVLVTVSYNPVAGKLEFHVEDWNTGGGQVEFN